jgi:hypothetical protein
MALLRDYGCSGLRVKRYVTKVTFTNGGAGIVVEVWRKGCPIRIHRYAAGYRRPSDCAEDCKHAVKRALKQAKLVDR